MIIGYYLELDDYMTEMASEDRYDVMRQYVNGAGELDADVEWENCSLSQGIERLRQLYASNPPTFGQTKDENNPAVFLPTAADERPDLLGALHAERLSLMVQELRAENERLRAERDKLKQSFVDEAKRHYKLAESAEGEVKKCFQYGGEVWLSAANSFALRHATPAGEGE